MDSSGHGLSKNAQTSNVPPTLSYQVDSQAVCVNSPEFYEVMIEILEENHARGRFPTTKVIKVIDEGLQIKVKL